MNNQPTERRSVAGVKYKEFSSKKLRWVREGTEKMSVYLCVWRNPRDRRSLLLPLQTGQQSQRESCARSARTSSESLRRSYISLLRLCAPVSLPSDYDMHTWQSLKLPPSAHQPANINTDFFCSTAPFLYLPASLYFSGCPGSPQCCHPSSLGANRWPVYSLPVTFPWGVKRRGHRTSPDEKHIGTTN